MKKNNGFFPAPLPRSVRTLEKSLILSAVGGVAVLLFYPELSVDEKTMIVTLPIVAMMIVVKGIDFIFWRLAARHPEPKPHMASCRRHYIAGVLLASGILLFFLNAVTAALYFAAGLTIVLSLAGWGILAGFIVAASGVVLALPDHKAENRARATMSGARLVHDFMHTPIPISQERERRVANW